MRIGVPRLTKSVAQTVRKSESMNSANAMNNGISPKVCGCRMCWYIPPNIFVLFEGRMVSWPASLVPFIKIGEHGTAMANATILPTSGSG